MDAVLTAAGIAAAGMAMVCAVFAMLTILAAVVSPDRAADDPRPEVATGCALLGLFWAMVAAAALWVLRGGPWS